VNGERKGGKARNQETGYRRQENLRFRVLTKKGFLCVVSPSVLSAVRRIWVLPLPLTKKGFLCGEKVSGSDPSSPWSSE